LQFFASTIPELGRLKMLRRYRSILFVFLILGAVTYLAQRSSASTSRQETVQPTPQAKVGRRGAAKSVVYVNKQYGFRFYLPKSWKGYSIVVTRWGGGTYNDEQGNPKNAEDGPVIYIGHPLSTKENPRQDIPIMVFTLAQWDLVESGQITVSAAPFGPGEIGRNAKYVFATPPRYNYVFPTGFEEVEEILQNDPLQPF
jgi:hypothetical protein